MKNTPNNNLIPVISFIWKFIRMQRFRFLCIFVFSLAWSLDSTVWPYLLRSIIDVFTQYDINRMAAWPILQHLLLYMGLLWVVVETGFRSGAFLQTSAFPKMEADIRMTLFDHVQHHSPKYFASHFSGDLANKINDMAAQAT
ncbi:MAG: ABC transporter ATP-binding protein, partial [Verrucomicrobia bacterium]|nr:ABC transporter ATP-binding protein [Verrucomicrobiota bacterium]